MSNVRAILVCYKFGSQWELPIETTARVSNCLVAWRTSPLPIDAGVPHEVARLLASTLVTHVRVSFPVHASQQGISFVHTRQVEELQLAFNATYFDWSQRGQILFLSSTEAPPTLSQKHLHLATNSQSFQQLADIGIIGLVLPGVDGNVAGIYTFVDHWLDALLTELKAACVQINTRFQEVTEAELAVALANQ
jgi:hypothetical protein